MVETRGSNPTSPLLPAVSEVCGNYAEARRLRIPSCLLLLLPPGCVLGRIDEWGDRRNSPELVLCENDAEVSLHGIERCESDRPLAASSCDAQLYRERHRQIGVRANCAFSERRRLLEVSRAVSLSGDRGAKGIEGSPPTLASRTSI